MDLDQVRRTASAYDTVAEAYARLLPDASYEAETDRTMIAMFVERLSGTTEATVLDAGCGTGRMLPFLRGVNPTLRVVGVDGSPAMVAQARAAHPDADLIEAPLHAIPVEDARIDGILAWYSLLHTRRR